MSENTIKLGAIGVGETPYRASDFAEQLKACDPARDLFIDIHSEGGSVMEGFEIFNLLSEWEGRKVARIRVAAFSIASYIAMACDEIEIANNGYFMIHNPYSETSGDDAAHAKNAAFLTGLKDSMIETYSARTGLPAEQIKDMMASESFIGASQSIEIGMADRIIESTKPTARQFPKNHLPTLVMASMYGSPSVDIPPAETPKEKPVSITKPVAASVPSIKAAYPKASNDFLVKCMEEEMDMGQVGEEYARAMQEENESLKAQLAKAMEDLENATAMTDPEEAVAMEEGEAPVATASGAAPVANVGGGNVADPKAAFESLIDANVAKGMNRTKAVIAANRANPSLRQAMVAHANGKLV